MKFSVSEIAKILKVDRDRAKLSVLAYISSYWEDDPDIESIKYGLNAGDNNEYPFNEIITETVPFFIEPPEGLDDTWQHGALRGNMGNYVDRFSLAEEYKLAGDLLVDSAIRNNVAYEVLAPIVYNYRHATELYLKSIVHKENEENLSHDLNSLLVGLMSLLKDKFNTEIPSWFEKLILAFHNFDREVQVSGMKEMIHLVRRVKYGWILNT